MEGGAVPLDHRVFEGDVDEVDDFRSEPWEAFEAMTPWGLSGLLGLSGLRSLSGLWGPSGLSYLSGPLGLSHPSPPSPPCQPRQVPLTSVINASLRKGYHLWCRRVVSFNGEIEEWILALRTRGRGRWRGKHLSRACGKD